MDRQQYIEKLLEHFDAPRHRGAIAGADVVMSGGNPSCGDSITIYLNVDEQDRVEQIQFEGEGCTISQASASILLDKVQGKTLAEIEAIDYNDLIEELGRDIVLTRVRCATLSLSTLKNAIQKYYEAQGSRVAE
ncbi:MAG: iron-sulfur cluster assembly scaffold protein [Anaerolineae bacterium]|nr:iron-sulfur cluster assembly scaffold protein [Anaerolineae bacterium]